MPRLFHKPVVEQALPVRREALLTATGTLLRARLHFGHGTDNAGDDAAALLAHALRLKGFLTEAMLNRPLGAAAARRFDALVTRRVIERMPVGYLTHRCWFAGLPMYVDERVLIPRSPIAELVEARFTPWVIPKEVRRIADIGTGSGCIAIACAMAFPKAKVDAVDTSQDALDVARINRRKYGLSRRLRLLKSNYFAALKGRRYDIIVSNPPYVGTAEFRRLPREYTHEPAGALLAGRDGMDAVRVLLRRAARHLTPKGILVVEVGNTEVRVRRALPKVPFVWLSFERGGGGVFLLTAQQLRAAGF
ncbi:MAG: 50S ribosomal protein L3 N(5)-glutamine methyltransferase [Pseudomonadota bacterium]